MVMNLYDRSARRRRAVGMVAISLALAVLAAGLAFAVASLVLSG